MATIIKNRLDSGVTSKNGEGNYANYLKFLSHNNYFNNNADSLTQRYITAPSRIQQDLLYYIDWNLKHQNLFKEIAELESLLSCDKEIEVCKN